MQKRVILALIAVITFFGSTFPGIKLALVDYSPAEMITLRFIFASIALVFFCYNKKMAKPLFKDIPLFLAFAIIGMVSYQFLLGWGEQFVSAGSAGFIVSLAPLFALLISYFVFKESLSMVKIVGSLIAISGVWLISLSEHISVNARMGLVILLVAALCWSLFFIFQKILLRRYTAFESVAYGIWIATLISLLFSHPTTLIHDVMKASTLSTLSVIYIGAITMSFAYYLWAYVLDHMEVSQASLYAYGIPFVSAILSGLFLDEQYTFTFWIGAALIVLGVMFARKPPRLEPIPLKPELVDE